MSMRDEQLTKQRRDEVNVRRTTAMGRRADLPDLSASFSEASPPLCCQDGLQRRQLTAEAKVW